MVGFPTMVISNVCSCRDSCLICGLSPLLPLLGSGPGPRATRNAKQAIWRQKAILFLSPVFEARLSRAGFGLTAQFLCIWGSASLAGPGLTSTVPTKAAIFALFNPKYWSQPFILNSPPSLPPQNSGRAHSMASFLCLSLLHNLDPQIPSPARIFRSLVAPFACCGLIVRLTLLRPLDSRYLSVLPPFLYTLTIFQVSSPWPK